MVFRMMVWLMLAAAAGTLVTNCAPTQPNALDSLSTVNMTIKGQPFRLWIADNNQERARGLMFITAEQMADLPDGTKRGMIFVFDHEQVLNFWMKNTIIPLDIAYVNAAGVMVSKYTMAPLDTRLGRYSSNQPAQFAIEVNANVFSDIDLRQGDRVEITAALLKTAP